MKRTLKGTYKDKKPIGCYPLWGYLQQKLQLCHQFRSIPYTLLL